MDYKTEPTLNNSSTPSSCIPKKCWMIYALACSLTLHIGVTLAIVISSSLKSEMDSADHFTFEDIVAVPTISTPLKRAMIKPSERAEAIPATQQLTATKPQPESIQEQLPISASNGNNKVDIRNSLGMGMTHGYFSGLSDGKTLRDDISGYYFEIVAKVNQGWWNSAELIKGTLRQDGIVELLIQRDGTIIAVRVLQGTGSSEADQLLTKTVNETSPLPPLPATYEADLFRAPLRIKAPSFLLRIK